MTDFDGTVSFEDFFWHVADKYFDKQALKPWQEYLNGTKTHFNALNQMFSGLREKPEIFDNFIQQIKFDPEFVPTMQLCKAKNIPVYMVSAGCDYYILRILDGILKEYNIRLITNHSSYTQNSGLSMIAPPKDSPYYDEKIGISKSSVVKNLQEQGYEVIYAGDGPPDLSPAKIADVVFAKKMLLELCQKNHIITQKFDDYKDIYQYIERL